MDKEWFLEKIPKICHFYWGGGPMVYLRYLSIKTFIKYNPDWSVIFWYPKYPFKGISWGIEPGYKKFNPNLSKDYFPQIMGLPITKVPVDFNSLKFGSITAEVHKADYMRINLLHIYGGVWADMDIIFFSPMEHLKINRVENKDVETIVCIGYYGHNTGFNMSCENNKMFGVLLSHLSKEYKSNNYQCWGPDIFNKYFNTMEEINKITPALNIDMDAVYAHDIHNVNEFLDKVKPRFTDNSIGCHWYGGHSQWGGYFNKTKGGTENLPDNLISNLIRNAK